MAGSLTLVEGPAGAGKSQEVAAMLASGEAEVSADVTALWAAVSGAQRGPDGRYPVRSDSDSALSVARVLQAAAVRTGLREGARVAVTTSRRGQGERWAEVAREEDAPFAVRTVDPGEGAVRARLAGPDGLLSAECEAAVGRWYG